MKKFTFSLLISLFTVGIIGNTAFASTETTKSSTEILTEVEAIANDSKSFDVINTNELPEGTPVINFDTVEEFEKAIKELDEENEIAKKELENQDIEYISPLDQITTFATTKSTTDRLKVIVKPSLNPIKSLTQPASVTVDLGYNYSGSGSSKKFTSIKKVSSFSFGVPTDWIQTSYSKSFYSSNKGVKLNINGYNLLGASIAGQPIGAKFSDTITVSYKLGGTKNLVLSL